MVKLTKKAAEQLRAHLAAQAPERLVELLLAQVERDNTLRASLLVEVAEAGGPPDLASYRRAFADALRSASAARQPGRTSGPWARNVQDAIGPIESLLRAGQGQAVVGLTEYALGRVDKAMSTLDDSAGWFATIIPRLESLHHEACASSAAEPVALARRLFAFEVDREWDLLIDSVERYADVLGEAGLAEMRRLARERWSSMPAAPPEAGTDRTPGRFHLTRMMEKLAIQAGDVDARVDVLARDLSHPYRYLQIAQVLEDAGRSDEALRWAERGLFAGGDDPRWVDSRLDDFLLAGYAERHRLVDVMGLSWHRFEQQPSPASYARLRRWSLFAGAWSERRLSALDRLRADAEKAARAPGPARSAAARRWQGASPGPPPYETLIAVLLEDGAEDEAWDLAREHGCSQALWMDLARAREADHPADAIPVYQREIEALIDRKDPRFYDSAVDMVGMVGELFRVIGDPAAFDAYVADLQRRHKAKSKLQRILADRGY